MQKQNILEDLYFGNIRLDIRPYSQSPAFIKAMRTRNGCMEKLEASLNSHGNELFEKYCEAQGEVEGIVNFDTFTYALRLGMMLMIEVFIEEPDISKGGMG